MKAFQLVTHGMPGKFELRDVPDPKPQPGEVMVDVRACGLNHLDLWLEEAGLPIKVELPRTPGGEISGVISEISEPANQRAASVSLATSETWHIGDRVAVQSNLFCR